MSTHSRMLAAAAATAAAAHTVCTGTPGTTPPNAAWLCPNSVPSGNKCPAACNKVGYTALDGTSLEATCNLGSWSTSAENMLVCLEKSEPRGHTAVCFMYAHLVHGVVFHGAPVAPFHNKMNVRAFSS
jgi:hypothetical protein